MRIWRIWLAKAIEYNQAVDGSSPVVCGGLMQTAVAASDVAAYVQMQYAARHPAFRAQDAGHQCRSCADYLFPPSTTSAARRFKRRVSSRVLSYFGRVSP